jgi:mono/diheme cytochrome c family protein
MVHFDNRHRIIGGVLAVATGAGLCLASVAQADSGPPTPNPLAPTLSPMVSQLTPQVQALLRLGAVPVSGVDITGVGAASSIHGDSGAGATKFAANCAVCHADHGVGGVPNPGSDDGTVPALNPIDPAFLEDANGSAAVLARDLDVFIQHGSRPSGPSPVLEMPAWGDHHLMSQNDIADVEAYVMSLSGVFWPDRCPGLQLEVANPSAGSRVEQGSFVVQGTAFDARAQQGSGVQRIDFFLGSRDAGGKFVGSTVPGATPGPTPNSFSATLSLPNEKGAQDLVAYALSAVGGEESVVSIPIALGEDPSKVFVVTPTAQKTVCTP